MSKRRFTREFKLTAVRRMQVGEPVARLARELEVGPGELYRWYHEQERLGQAPSWARDTSGPRRIGWRSWSARSGNRPWRLIF